MFKDDLEIDLKNTLVSVTDLIIELEKTYPIMPSNLEERVDNTKNLILNVNYDYETKKVQRFLTKITGRYMRRQSN